MKMFMDPVFPTNAGIHVHSDGRKDYVGRPYYTQDQANGLAVSAAPWHAGATASDLGDRAGAGGAGARGPRVGSGRSAAPHRALLVADAGTDRPLPNSVSPWSTSPRFYRDGERAAVTLSEAGIDTPPAPYRTMLDEGVNIVASSDFVRAAAAPRGHLLAGERRSRDSADSIAPEEALTAEEAIGLYTLGGARAMHREMEAGSIEVGARRPRCVEPRSDVCGTGIHPRNRRRTDFRRWTQALRLLRSPGPKGTCATRRRLGATARGDACGTTKCDPGGRDLVLWPHTERNGLHDRRRSP